MASVPRWKSPKYGVGLTAGERNPAGFRFHVRLHHAGPRLKGSYGLRSAKPAPTLAARDKSDRRVIMRLRCSVAGFGSYFVTMNGEFVIMPMTVP
jgi:hypothetical protein